MLEFIKMFGLGILYTILSPFILAFFLLFVIYSVFNYLFFEVVNLSGFFMGKRFSEKTDLDRELDKIRKNKEIVKTTVENAIDQPMNSINNEDGDNHA